MGKIENNNDFIYSKLNLILISSLQKEIIENITLLFKNIKLNTIAIDSEMNTGAHGIYENQNTYLIKINMRFMNFIIDFFIDYDQLEYYISLNGKITKQCNLECYFEDKIIIEKFINYLKKDLENLGILNN